VYETSRPAIAGNLRCSVFKLGPKYNCKRVHLTSLYPIRRWRRHMIIWVFYVTMFVLKAKLCRILALISDLFGGLNFFLYLGFYFFCSGNLGGFKSSGNTAAHVVTPTRSRALILRVQWTSCKWSNVIIYPSKSAIMWCIQTPHLVQLMNIVSN